MKFSIRLSENTAFRWYSNDGCYTKGFAYSDTNYIEGQELNQFFKDFKSYDDLKSAISEMNGLFCAIVQFGNALCIVQDIIRSFPVFYAFGTDEVFISDEAENVSKCLNEARINEIAAKEFLSTGFVTGKETLVEKLWQVQAGEVLLLKEGTGNSSFYFSFYTSILLPASYAALRKQACDSFEKVSGRFIDSLKGRPVALPLSGGFDSRLLACMLHRAGYTNVICYTYGRKGNPELEKSRLVAERLGFKWLFIEYNEELIADFLTSDEFVNYHHWGANLSSMFYLQEYFAVKYLRDEEKLSVDTIFVPGHSGDFLGGSQFKKHNFSGKNDSLKKVVNRIFRIKYQYYYHRGRDAKLIKKRILNSILDKGSLASDFSYSIHEDWDMKEKLSKYNNNSNSIYTYFGFEYRTPFWDKELVDFFKNLPIEFRIGKKLYDDVLVNEYFRGAGVSFSDELQDELKSTAYPRFKKRIKKYLPPVLMEKMEKKEDDIYYYEMSKQFLKDLEDRGIDIHFYGNKYQKVLIRWYLDEVKSNLENE